MTGPLKDVMAKYDVGLLLICIVCEFCRSPFMISRPGIWCNSIIVVFYVGRWQLGAIFHLSACGSRNADSGMKHQQA